MNQPRASSASTSSTEGIIYVDESDYSDDDWVLPFDQRGVVRIRTDEKFSDFYEIFGTIGEGKFGTVYRCREKSTGLELAAKRIAIKRDADRHNVEQEVAIMQKMRHPRIAQIYDAFATKKNDIILIMEVVEGGELFDRVADENYVLTELAVVMIICQLCEAIDYIHSQNIVHLDVKPENIMCVSQTGNRIKLIDFGLAQYYDGSKDLLLMAGTPEFAAPEVIKFEPIDFRTDMWSVGVITYILLSGISPFLGENNAETYNNVTKGHWEFDEEAFGGISDQAKHFVSNLIVYKKDKRMTARQCLEHPWIVESRRTARQSSSASAFNSPAIDTEKLRRYVHMRRWKKATLAIFAVQRMGWNWLNKRLRLAKCVTDQMIANREAVESAEKIVPLKTNQSLKNSASLSPREKAGNATANADRKAPLKSPATVTEGQSLSPGTKAKRLKVSAPSPDAPATKVDTPSAISTPLLIITSDAASKTTDLNAPKPTEEKKKEKLGAAKPTSPEPSKTVKKVSTIAKNLDTKSSSPAIATDSPPTTNKIENVRRAFVFNSIAQREATTTKIVHFPSKVNASAAGATTEGRIKIRKKWSELFSITVKKPSSPTETSEAADAEKTVASKMSAKKTATSPQPPPTESAQQSENGSVKPAKVTKRPIVKIETPDEKIVQKPSADSSAQASRSDDTNRLPPIPPKNAPNAANSESGSPTSEPIAIKKKSTTAKTTELKLKTTEAKVEVATVAPAKGAKEADDKTKTITKLQPPSPNASAAEELPLMPLGTGLAAVGRRRKPSVANSSSAILKLCAGVLEDSRPREREKCGSNIDADMSGDEQSTTPVDPPSSSAPAAADAKATQSSTKTPVASPRASAMDPSSGGTKQMLAVSKAAVRINSANAVTPAVPSTSPSKDAKSSPQPNANDNNRPPTTGVAAVDSPAKPIPSLSTSKSTTKRLAVPKVEANTDESSKQVGSPVGKLHFSAKNTDQTGCASTAPAGNVTGDKQILVDPAKSEGKQPTSKKPAAKPAEARKQERLTKEVANPDAAINSSTAPASASTIPPSSPTKLLRQRQDNTIAETSQAQSSKSTTQKQEKSSPDRQLGKEATGTGEDSSITRKKAAVRTIAKTESASTATPTKKTKPLDTEPSTTPQNPADLAKATSSSNKPVIKRKVQPSPKTASKSLSGETIVPKKIVCEDDRKDNKGALPEASNSNSSNPKSPSSTKEDKGVKKQAVSSDKTEFEWAKSVLESRLKNDGKASSDKKGTPRRQGDQTGNALRALQAWKDRDQQLAASNQAEPPRLAVSAI